MIAPELRIINPIQWRDEPVPEREWIVRDKIPAKTVTLLSGDGAVGKSTLALPLATARALGRDWIGTVPAPGRSPLWAKVPCEAKSREGESFRPRLPSRRWF